MTKEVYLSVTVKDDVAEGTPASERHPLQVRF
jgi:hypothetical protein